MSRELLFVPVREFSQRHQSVLWAAVREELTLPNGNFSRVKLFGEGIVAPLPPAGYAIFNSRHGELYRSLYLMGANIVASEDPELDEEAVRFSRLIARDTLEYSPTKLGFVNLLRQNTEKRGIFLANAVNENLLEDEQGIIVVSTCYRLLSKLDSDITVRTLKSIEEDLLKIHSGVKIDSGDQVVIIQGKVDIQA